MSAAGVTLTVRRAIDAVLSSPSIGGTHAIVTIALDVVLDVEEVTEILAREQWNRLPLVLSGQMVQWDDETVTELQRKHFRDRCRPFAEAIRANVLGGAA